MGMQLILANGTVQENYKDLSLEGFMALSFARLYDVYDLNGKKVNRCVPKLTTKHWQETKKLGKGGTYCYRSKNQKPVPGVCAHYYNNLRKKFETRMAINK